MKNNTMMLIIFKKYNNMVNNMPMPSNISYMWNYGSLLGLFLIIQILTGLFLSMHYSSISTEAFNSISHIMRNVNLGWYTRLLHANGASFFFFMMYIHISRNLFYNSYKIYFTWLSGIIIFFMSMMIAFIGYVLPWGQMSFWGATVITNLLTALPYMGKSLTLWIWGGFSINNSTLMRFFSLHFILPLILILIIMIHLSTLHNQGSSNPIGSNSMMDKMPFMPFFYWKDLFMGIFIFFLFSFICLIKPYMFMDPDNFTPANPMNTPIHIQPEWYFLFAYAILRSIPNKLGGVLCLFLSILMFLWLPLININYTSNSINPLMKLFLFYWMWNFIFLTYLGSCSISYPFINLSQLSSLMYFSLFFFYNYSKLILNKS